MIHYDKSDWIMNFANSMSDTNLDLKSPKLRFKQIFESNNADFRRL